LDKPTLEIEVQINNNIINKYFNKYQINHHQEIKDANAITECRNMICENIDYDSLVIEFKNEHSNIDEIVTLITNTVFTFHSLSFSIAIAVHTIHVCN
jgi:hypothetical protein